MILFDEPTEVGLGSLGVTETAIFAPDPDLFDPTMEEEVLDGKSIDEDRLIFIRLFICASERDVP